MSIAPARKSAPTHDIPLANLFAYIRDLFHSSDPVFRFEEDGRTRKVRNESWWSLADWQRLHDADQLEFQWQSPDSPILSLQRVELPPMPPVPEDLQGWLSQQEEPGQLPKLVPIRQRELPFASNPKRMSAYREFHLRVHDRPVAEVQDLTIPAILTNWVDIRTEEDRVFVEVNKTGIERFEDDDLRQELLTAYERVHGEHFQQHAQALAVNQLFDALHAAHYELKAHAEQRLFLSFGLVSGQMGQEAYRNFLFHIPLRLEIKKLELHIFPDTFSQTIRCEQAFTELLEQIFPKESAFQIDQRRQHVLSTVDQFHQEPHEFNLDGGYLRHSYYEAALKLLEVFPEVEDRFFDGKELNWTYEGTHSGKGLSFSFSPVVHTRVVESHEHIAKDASHIIEKINELSSTGESDRIPDFFKKLFSLRRPEHKLRIAHKVENRSHLDAEITSEAMPERLLFPLPSNREQRAIAERLARQDAVTVMGPPGTGKSHTIANLTSHYVSQGKSVLIVSRYAKALEVIREKLPGGIRNLAVSFNQQDPQHDALKHAIDAIKENLSRPINPDEIRDLEQELQILESRYRDLLHSIRSWMDSHQEQVMLHHPQLGAVTLTVAEWAKTHFDPAYQAQVLLDELPADQSVESLAQRFEAWTRQFSGVNLDLLAYTWPELEAFPKQEEVAEKLESIRKLRAQPEPAAYERHSYGQLASIIEEQLHRSKEDKKWLADQTPWMLSGEFDESTLGNLLAQLEQLCAGWEQEQRALLPYSFDLAALSEQDWELWQEESRKLWDKMGSGLNALQKKMLSKFHKALFDCRVNGRKVETREQLHLVMRRIDQELRRKQWHIALSNYLAAFGQSVDREEVESWRRKLIIGLTNYRNVQLFEQEMRSQGLPIGSLLGEESQQHWDWLTGAPLYLRWQEAEDDFTRMTHQLRSMKGLSASGEAILDALSSRDLRAYQAALVSYEADLARMMLAKAWKEEETDWAAILPNSVAAFFTEERPISANAFLSDVFHADLKAMIHLRLTASAESHAALEQLRGLQQEIETRIADLITLQTWDRKQREVSDEQRSALSAWRNDLINIGKGYGKNTERNLQSAVTNMQLAKGAVPVWIMQQDTAITFFPEVEPGQFDLLIVDEASQCDISMLNLIFRSKKCIIVGDENQTSVATQASLFPIDRTNQLLDRYLVNHPFKQQFNINNRTASIYTLSGVIYPNIVTLREHFRCRPELIGFSNKYVYDDQIVPLRTATDNRYGHPLEAHFVEDDPTDKRRPQLVRQAVQLITDLIEDYENQQLTELPSIGLLTLDASHEEHREHLIRELARHPKVKEYAEELNLLVGTSREFQGDERDVMILTSTASHRYTESGDLRPPRAVLGEEMMRIYNVAISRARDKAILLHSAHPESVLKMNEDCYRRRLIEYCNGASLGEPSRELSAVEVMDRARSLYGEWGAEVVKTVQESSLGEGLLSSLRVGPYKLDLALIRDGKKIGILLDGLEARDEEQSLQALDMQLTLSRAGWNCYRLPMTDWYANGEAARAQLLSFLA
ncbi:MAG: AAA family ATPase [Bacteroidia bacterium]|nr:AAA family ATPase [Bacteroidia bacterium]